MRKSKVRMGRVPEEWANWVNVQSRELNMPKTDIMRILGKKFNQENFKLEIEGTLKYNKKRGGWP